MPKELDQYTPAEHRKALDALAADVRRAPNTIRWEACSNGPSGVEASGLIQCRRAALRIARSMANRNGKAVLIKHYPGPGFRQRVTQTLTESEQ